MFIGKHRHSARNQKGNMLVLGCFALTFSALLIVIGYSFAGMVFVQNHLKNSAEEIALSGAIKLNELDNVGQMDNMLARNRQLVYAQQVNNDTAQASGTQYVQNLASDLLDESKQSASIMEAERVKLKPIVESDAASAMNDKFEEVANTYMMNLPWLKIERPVMTLTSLGKISGVQSSVVEFPVQTDLVSNDRSQKLVQINKDGLNIYLESTNHKLPAPNDGLPYKLSSLPAPVNNQVSPARVVPDQDLAQVQGDYFTSATEVQLSLTVHAGLGPSSAVKVVANGVAIAAGASNQQ
jgi:hypothetical protein